MIEELTAKEFDEFAQSHILSNYHQSSSYAELMCKNGYSKIYIGYKDSKGNILAGSLILLKKISHIFLYGYAPKGFLIDYNNKKLVKDFTNKLKEYAKNKKIIFIKINPEIPTYKYNEKFRKKTLSNINIINTLEENNYIKLKDNIYFESMIPRFNGIIDLKKYDVKKIDSTHRNKINSGKRKGLEIEITNDNKVKYLYPFIKNKKRKRNYFYYKNYFNIFNDIGSADIFLVKINYDTYLKNSKKIYEKELLNNKKVTDEYLKDNSEKNLNKKINSNKLLLTYKNDMINATYNIGKDPNDYIAGAICIKYKNHIHIVISGYNNIYGNLNPNYFLHNEIINYYKDSYDFLDLNGITGDFTIDNPYRGLNEFKLGFKPNIYEFIGEFDLVINEKKYDFLLNYGLLEKEFTKKD